MTGGLTKYFLNPEAVWDVSVWAGNPAIDAESAGVVIRSKLGAGQTAYKRTIVLLAGIPSVYFFVSVGFFSLAGYFVQVIPFIPLMIEWLIVFGIWCVLVCWAVCYWEVPSILERHVHIDAFKEDDDGIAGSGRMVLRPGSVGNRGKVTRSSHALRRAIAAIEQRDKLVDVTWRLVNEPRVDGNSDCNCVLVVRECAPRSTAAEPRSVRIPLSDSEHEFAARFKGRTTG